MPAFPDALHIHYGFILTKNFVVWFTNLENERSLVMLFFSTTESEHC